MADVFEKEREERQSGEKKKGEGRREGVNVYISNKNLNQSDTA